MANLRTNNLFGESGQDSNGSALFDGSDNLTAANAAAFRLNQGSTENFTMEAWIYFTGTDYGFISGIYETSGNQRSYQLYLSSDFELKFNYASSGTAGSVSTLTGNVVPKNQWVHVAVAHEVSSTTLRLFLNGLNVATDNAPHTTYYANTTSDFFLGKQFVGNISNFHITKSCKYTGNFTPSKEPIEEDSNTTVLCCNSRFNPLSDDKSNTFTQTTAGAVEASSFIPFDRADSGNVFNGSIKHNTQGYMYFPTGRTEERGGTRGLAAGGSDGNELDEIQFVNIASEGNAIQFGNLSVDSHNVAGMSSKTRAVFSLGYVDASPNISNVIEFVTIMTQGNATDFGDTSFSTYESGAVSNDTRGLVAGGYDGSGSGTPNNTEQIDFITIATLGNGADFGDLTLGRRGLSGCGSPTRGVFAAGYQQPDTSTKTNVIDFVTIASAGNAQDFGDLTSQRWGTAACSDSTRGVFSGGATPGVLNVIDFITIATTGNAADFGDLVTAAGRSSATSDRIRGVIFSGYSPSVNNIIEVLTIQTTGNSKDFGDTYKSTHSPGTASNAHGGLS